MPGTKMAGMKSNVDPMMCYYRRNFVILVITERAIIIR